MGPLTSIVHSAAPDLPESTVVSQSPLPSKVRTLIKKSLTNTTDIECTYVVSAIELTKQNKRTHNLRVRLVVRMIDVTTSVAKE